MSRFDNDKENNPFPTPREARERYTEEPFLPFWEKERLLGSMFKRDAEFVAKNDVFLPSFSKQKFVPEEKK